MATVQLLISALFTVLSEGFLSEQVDDTQKLYPQLPELDDDESGLLQLKTVRKSTSCNCVGKSAVHSGFAFLFDNGDPCFQYAGNDYCFQTAESNMLYPCDRDVCNQGVSVTQPPDTTCDEADASIATNTCGSTDSNEFCQAPFTNSHTMCKFCGNNEANCCNVQNRALDEAQKDDIVAKHNELRRQVAKGLQTPQPSAANMYELKWSDEVAEIAQRWADQCDFGHDNNNDRKTKDAAGNLVYNGQNAAWSGGSSAQMNFNSTIQSWFDEVTDFSASWVDNFSDVDVPDGVMVGHYTQLVWAETKEVGCGYVHYKTSASAFSNNHLLVCNYRQGGNWGGQPVYVKTDGAPGSGCANNDDGLCIW